MQHPATLAGILTAIFSVLATPLQATEVFSTAFASLADGAVTQTDLDSATTGGTWFLKTDRGASFTIQDSSGDKALLLDDPDLTGNSGEIQFGTATLTTPIDLATQAATWTFRTATRRTGPDRSLRFQFLNAAGTSVAAQLDWTSTGTITLNTNQASDASAFVFQNPWDAASTNVRDVSVHFSGGTITATFGGVSLVGTVINGVADIGRLRVSSSGSSVSTRGVFLNDLSVTTTPVETNDFHYRGLTAGDPDYDRDLIRVFVPPSGVTGAETRPAILMFHGGGWGTGSLSQFEAFCQSLADMGFVTATANYRYSSNTAANAYADKKELCIADARLATAWLEARAAFFGFADGRIILGGGSAGGHLATMVALQPEELAAVAAGPLSIPALLLFNPAYDVSETSGAASLRVDPERQLAELVAANLLPPPAIHLFGNYDPWRTPATFTNATQATEQGIGRALPFIEACRQADAQAELWYAVGQAHSFFNATEWLERCIVAIDDFLTGLGITPVNTPPSSFDHPELPFVLGTAIHPWRLQWFRNEFATGNAADDANPDADAFDNFTEFALGTHPLVANLTAPLGFDPAVGTPTLRFSRRQYSYAFADPASVVELRSSTTLAPGSWETLPIKPEHIVGTTDGIETLAVPLDTTADPARFYRLEIRPYP